MIPKGRAPIWLRISGHYKTRYLSLGVKVLLSRDEGWDERGDVPADDEPSVAPPCPNCSLNPDLESRANQPRNSWIFSPATAGAFALVGAGLSVVIVEKPGI